MPLHEAAGGGNMAAAQEGVTSDTDWWLWMMFTFFIFACIIVFLIIIFEDPEVRSYSSHQARRLSDWYNERAMRQHQDEMMMLQAHHRQQEPNPPLYQTIVPPTYQYQKPPTPHEPPPKYEESPQPPHDPIEDIIAAREVPSPSGENGVPIPGQPQYVKKGKVKKSRTSPLLKQIRSIEGHKLLTSGHNIFVRKSVNNTAEAPTPDPVDLSEIPEEMVFELNTNPVNTFEVQ